MLYCSKYTEFGAGHCTPETQLHHFLSSFLKESAPSLLLQQIRKQIFKVYNLQGPTQILVTNDHSELSMVRSFMG